MGGAWALVATEPCFMSALSTNSHAHELFYFFPAVHCFHFTNHILTSLIQKMCNFWCGLGFCSFFSTITTSHHYQPHPSSLTRTLSGSARVVFELFILQIGERPSLAAFQWFATYWLCLVRRLLISFTNRFL